MFKIKNKDSRALTSFCSKVYGDLQHGLLADIFLLKINNRDSTMTCEICEDITKQKHQNEVNDVILVSLFLTLNLFALLF